MPLQLPNLDDRRYADLVAEARRLIPVHDPDWTNHNPSDPGITLVELFAYLTEMLLYRLDRVTAENQRKFLRLLNGPDQPPGADLNVDIRDAVLAVRARERAVTAADFERLTIENFNAWLAGMQRLEQEGKPLDEWWQITRLDRTDAANLPSHVPPVARAACLPSRNLDRGTEATRTEHAPAHVSLIVLPQQANPRQPPMLQKTALWGYLDDWRTLTTRHHVVGPHHAPISAEIVIACTSDAVTTAVRDRVMAQLENFLKPLGDAVQEGWPFGRNVYVTDLMLSSTCPPAEEKCAAASPLWHPEGDLIGMALQRAPPAARALRCRLHRGCAEHQLSAGAVGCATDQGCGNRCGGAQTPGEDHGPPIPSSASRRPRPGHVGGYGSRARGPASRARRHFRGHGGGAGSAG
jgi:hypothetical protein